MKHPFKFWRYALGLALTFIALGGAQTASAQIDGGVKVEQVGIVGVARGQLVRLNVFYRNTFPPGPCKPGDSCAATGSFQTTLSFVDTDGNTVARNLVTLTPEKGAALVYSPSSFQSDGRASVRGVVSAEPDANGFTPELVPSVEVMDSATGQTSLLNPGAIAGFNPQPEPPGDFNFGLFNVVKGQTARVSVSFVDAPRGFPPGPCRVTLSFYDGDGRLISQSTQSLDPGKTAQFDYPTDSFTPGSRARIRASVSVEPSDDGIIPCVMPAVEVFDAATGKGAFYYPGAMIGSD
ncbi:MAG: hypothetical protein M3444_12405 [Acidobacteriota bacterium]|nr:hypothetical protein [Acidobacteriota bacterium]MDQ5835924.1 hypothetical protein [Acidobacteriota bacterium]